MPYGKSFGQSLPNKFLGSGEGANQPLDPTISKDRTMGDEARKRVLLAEFGRKSKAQLAGPSFAAVGARRGKSSVIPGSNIQIRDDTERINILIAEYERACRRDAEETGDSSERAIFLERYSMFDIANPLPTVAEVRHDLSIYFRSLQGTYQAVRDYLTAARDDLIIKLGRHDGMAFISHVLEKDTGYRSGWQATVKHEDRRDRVLDLALRLIKVRPFLDRRENIEYASRIECKIFHTSPDKMTWEKTVSTLGIGKR